MMYASEQAWNELNARLVAIRTERDATVARAERLEKAIAAAHERCTRALAEPKDGDTEALGRIATILEAAMERNNG